MLEIIKKAGSFFEEHIEKIILVAVGLVCIWLLFTRVLFSPNVVKHDGRKFSPSGIDEYINEQAEDLMTKLEEKPKLKEPYGPRFNGPIDPNDPVRENIWGDLDRGFVGLMASAINDIDASLSLSLPRYSSMEIVAKRSYRLPEIGEVKDVAVEHIQAVAYVPTEEITEEVTYDKAAHEPNDIDLVTVEAKFDAAELYRRFRDSFTGLNIPEEWRDPCLAKPVFAAVHLQRRESIENGSWSQWQDVARSRIDRHKRLFQIIEDISGLPPGGIKVRLLQFDHPEIMIDLLQPVSYQIASAKEEWFPPSLHNRFLELQRKEALEEKREAREAEKEEDQQDLDRRAERRGRGTRSGVGGRTGGLTEGYYGGVEGLYGGSDVRSRRSRDDRRSRSGGGLYDGMLYGDRSADRTRRPTTRRDRDEREPGSDYMMMPGLDASGRTSTDEVYQEFQEISLTPMTDLSKMREPLLFWAHDDTVEPGKSYQYRLRLGVFNPVAGTNQLSQQDKNKANKVVLWSEFSDTTERIDIPKRMYFFANEIQEAAKTVTVQICKYVLGYWYSENFAVRPGEVIGKVVELEVEKPQVRTIGGGLTYYASNPAEQVTTPESIDYSTGALLVDSVLVNDYDWAGANNLRPRFYYEMLYSYNGMEIERMPIRSKNWPAEMAAVFNEIRRALREPKEPFRAWGGQKRRTVLPGGYEGMEGYQEYDMMLQEMLQGAGRY